MGKTKGLCGRRAFGHTGDLEVQRIRARAGFRLKGLAGAATYLSLHCFIDGHILMLVIAWIGVDSVDNAGVAIGRPK